MHSETVPLHGLWAEAAQPLELACMVGGPWVTMPFHSPP